MTNAFARYILLIILLSLSGCGSQSYQPTAPSALTLQGTEVREQLLAQYREWQGVPYRLGGNDKSGIDCSAFTQLTYRQRLGLSLPRTTKHQSEVGSQVASSELKPGDLLFYRSRIKVRHVGIYMGHGQFLHASTSQGVMISEIENPYWAGHFWQARRLK